MIIDVYCLRCHKPLGPNVMIVEPDTKTANRVIWVMPCKECMSKQREHLCLIYQGDSNAKTITRQG